MHHEPSEDETSLPSSASRVENSLADLNARIARLAILLNVSLASEADFVKILNREPPFVPLHPSVWDANASNQGEHRLQCEWEELRGLLVLRCDMMKHSIEELGLEATRAITSQIEAQLEREGFKPGADGFHMLRPLAET